MSGNFYVGVENEFILYRRAKRKHKDAYTVIDFPDVFPALMEKYPEPCFRKGSTCIRTIHGSSIYADQEEAEVCTPPVFVQKGFASALYDAIINARHDITTFISGDPTLAIVGYSMHHNISARDKRSGIDDNGFMRRYAAPLAMFALTPTSIGINMREKPDRRELLADHIPDVEQTTMLHLLYAAAQLSPVRSDVLITDDAEEFDCGYSNPVSDGRDGTLAVKVGKRVTEITMQEYLERTYRALKPTILELATIAEHEILLQYIAGTRELEIDKRRAYDRTKTDAGMIPPTSTTITHPNTYSKPRPVPPGVPVALAQLARSDMPRRGDMPYLRTALMEWNCATFAGTESGFSEKPGMVQFKDMDELEIAGRTIDLIGDPDSRSQTLLDLARLFEAYSHRAIVSTLRNPGRNMGRVLSRRMRRWDFLEYAMGEQQQRNGKGNALLQAYEDVMFRARTPKRGQKSA